MLLRIFIHCFQQYFNTKKEAKTREIKERWWGEIESGGEREGVEE